MKNTVIKVLNKEHGKKVIDWFKSQGVNTNQHSGGCTEEDGDNHIYYGSIDGFFTNFNIEDVKRKNAIIMTLPETEKTQLDVCNEIYKPGMEVETCCGTIGVIDNTPFRFGRSDERVYANDGEICLYDTSDGSYAKIVLKLPEELDLTTDQGKLAYAKKHYPVGTRYESPEYPGRIFTVGKANEGHQYWLGTGTYKNSVVANLGENRQRGQFVCFLGKWGKIIKEEEMEKQQLSRKGLKEIHSVACGNWKLVLEKHGTRNPLEDYVELTQEEVNEMFKACTKNQLSIVSKYLKEDDGSIDVSKVKYGQDGVLLKDKYIIRHNAISSIKNGFWLNPDYNWEIKNIAGTPFLVPTKK